MNKKTLLAIFLSIVAISILVVQHNSLAKTGSGGFKPLPPGIYGPPVPIKIPSKSKLKAQGCIVEYDKNSPVKPKGCLNFYEE